jgi:hypothetical protein
MLSVLTVGSTQRRHVFVDFVMRQAVPACAREQAAFRKNHSDWVKFLAKLRPRDNFQIGV